MEDFLRKHAISLVELVNRSGKLEVILATYL